MTKKSYTDRPASEFNWFRKFFLWLTCRGVYGTFFRFAYGLKIYGRENVPKKGFFIVAANHVSAADPFLVVDAMGRSVAYMAKKELFDQPFSRFFLDYLGAFAVDRCKLGVSTIKTAKRIKNTDWILGLFPQGTREIDGNMDNVTRGFAGLAKSLECPIVPVAIIGAAKEERIFFKSKMKLIIGEPIPFDKDTNQMITTWSDRIGELIKGGS